MTRRDMTRPDMTIREMTAADEPWVWDLNEIHKVALSELSRARLAVLRTAAFAARVADDRAAFLLSFDQDAPYDSANFVWFRDRYARFAYVDRIAVARAHRRRGLAASLYRDLFDLARGSGRDRVVCEVNADPPNPDSDAFHAALGFRIVGEARLGGSGKTVRYMEHLL